MKNTLKTTLFILSLLSFLALQVQAQACALHCEVMAGQNKASGEAKPMKADHSCCDKNESKEKKEGSSPLDCAGNFGQSCLHKLSSTTKIEVPTLKQQLNSDAQVFLLQAAFFELDLHRLNESIYHPKIPHDFNRQFLRFKSDLRLHILKDQFLI